MKIGIFFFAIFGTLIGFSEEPKEEILFPFYQSHIDKEIDELLERSEHLLFSGDFKIALENIQRAETLLALSLVDSRKELRIAFDKAIVIICLEGLTNHSYECQERFEKILHSKRCQEHQFVAGKKDWQIFGPEVMTREECKETVDNMVDFALVAAASLPINRKSLFAVENIIYTLGKEAKQCCTKNGFWKECMQPLVNAAKNMRAFGIPPDPIWD